MAGAGEALAGDAVADQDEPRRLDAMASLDLTAHHLRVAHDPLARIREHAPVDFREHGVARREAPKLARRRRVAAAQVVEVASGAGAIEILVERARERVHDVVVAARGRPRRRARERHHAQRLPERRGADAVEHHVRTRRRTARDHVHLVAGSREAFGHTPRDALGAADPRLEALDHQRDPHGTRRV